MNNFNNIAKMNLQYYIVVDVSSKQKEVAEMTKKQT